jgi:hypothetical protein
MSDDEEKKGLIHAAGYSRLPTRTAGDLELSTPALRVLIAICRFVDGDGKAWPSITTIAELAGLFFTQDGKKVPARHKVPPLIAELERRGYLSRRHRFDDAGDPTSTEYTIHFEGVLPEPGNACYPNQVTPVTSAGEHGVTSPREHGVLPQSGNRSIPLSKNPKGSTGSVSKDTGAARREASPHVNGTTVEFPKPPPTRPKPPKPPIDPQLAASFEEWWNRFPDRRPKRLASRSESLDHYRELVQRGVDPKDLLADMLRDVASPNGKFRNYRPSFWLFCKKLELERRPNPFTRAPGNTTAATS